MTQWAYTVTQGVVTIALLVVAWLFKDDPHITDLIVGAVVSQWLREGVYVSQTIARNNSPTTVQVPIEVPPISAEVHPKSNGEKETG